MPSSNGSIGGNEFSWTTSFPNGIFYQGSDREYKTNRQDYSMMDRIFSSSSVDQRIEDEQARLAYDRELASAREAMNFEAKQAQLNRDFQQASAREAMAFEADQAKINRDWIDQQRSNAYQTAVSDLRAAGLNPILAASTSGAPVTSSSVASGFSSGGATASGYAASSSPGRRVYDTQAVLQHFISSAVSLLTSGAGLYASTLPRHTYHYRR